METDQMNHLIMSVFEICDKTAAFWHRCIITFHEWCKMDLNLICHLSFADSLLVLKWWDNFFSEKCMFMENSSLLYLCEPSDCFSASGLLQQKFCSLMMYWVSMAGYGHLSLKAGSLEDTGPWAMTLKMRKWPYIISFWLFFLCCFYLFHFACLWVHSAPLAPGSLMVSSKVMLCWSHQPPQYPKRPMVCWWATPAPGTSSSGWGAVPPLAGPESRAGGSGKGWVGLSCMSCRKCHHLGQWSHFCRGRPLS